MLPVGLPLPVTWSNLPVMVMTFNSFEYQGNGLWTQRVMDAHGDVFQILIIGLGNPETYSGQGGEPRYRRYGVRVDNHEIPGEYEERNDALEAAYQYVGRTGTQTS